MSYFAISICMFLLYFCSSFAKLFSPHLPHDKTRSACLSPPWQRKTNISRVIRSLVLSLSLSHTHGWFRNHQGTRVTTCSLRHSYTKTNADTHTDSLLEWIWKRAEHTLGLALAASYLIVRQVTMETGAAAAWQTSSASVFYSICACVCICVRVGGVSLLCAEHRDLGLISCWTKEQGFVYKLKSHGLRADVQSVKLRPQMWHNEWFTLGQNKHSKRNLQLQYSKNKVWLC